MTQPRYPIYIPTKGRAKILHTAQMFDKDGVEFRLVVEPDEAENYDQASNGRLLVLPENGKGLVYARNWIKKHAVAEGHARHWQFDDDINYMLRMFKGHRIPCVTNVALAAAEDFVDRYENVALASFNSEFFVPTTGLFAKQWPPFYRNARCYTCFLMLNALPNQWRFRYNEDTDMTLQVLADGWCTILFNAFMINTAATMTASGGQTAIYANDGRLKMARELERLWPGVVSTKRKFGRPQHHVKGLWKKFDTALKLKPGVDLARMKPNNYGLELKAVAPVKSAELQELLKKN